MLGSLHARNQSLTVTNDGACAQRTLARGVVVAALSLFAAALLLPGPAVRDLEARPISNHVSVAGPPRLLIDPREMIDEAKKLQEKGETARASELFRKAFFIDPGQKKAIRGWQEIRKAQAAELAEEAESFFATNPERASQLLRRAAHQNAKDPLTKKLLRKHKFKEVRGVWRSQDEVSEFELKHEEWEEKRKKEIDVDLDFAVIYRGPFRFFTNVDTRQAKSTLQQMMDSIDSHYRKYLELMSAFELQPAENLDVVLFAKQSEYMASRGVPGSAGVYYPGLGCAYFFAEGGWNFSTMLHEMTHQLNMKLLLTPTIQAWYEEGISEYYGAAFLTQAGRRIEVGRVDGARLATFQSAVRGHGGGSIIPLEEFVNMQRAQLSGIFYSQGWALTHYLLEVHPYGRAILFDFIEGHRTGEGTPIDQIIPLYVDSFDAFVDEFLEYFRTGGHAG